MKLSLKGWKKKSSDQHHTVLSNKEGHELKIYHKALNPEAQKMLAGLDDAFAGQKMAQGGQVQPQPKDKEAGFKKNAKEFEKGFNSGEDFGKSVQNFKQALGFADGGAVEDESEDALSPEEAEYNLRNDPNIISDAAPSQYRMAQSMTGEALPGGKPRTPEQIAAFRAGVEAATKGAKPMSVEDVLPMGDEEEASDEKPMPFEQVPASMTEEGITTPPVMNPEMIASNAQIPTRTASPEEQLAGAGPKVPVRPYAMPAQQAVPMAAQPLPPPAKQPAPPSQAATDPYGSQGYAQNFVGGLEAATKGIRGEAQAAAQQAQNEAAAAQDMIDMQQKFMSDMAKRMNDNHQEYQNFIDDVQASHINPNQYMENRSLAGQIATGLGLILGGIGAGITRGPNQALEMLQKNIDRDIEAQKANLGKRENLLSANLKHFGNLHDAVAMTSAMQNGILINQLKVAAANATDPMVKARAEAAIGQLYMEKVAPAMRSIALNQTLMENLGDLGNDTQKAGQLVQIHRLVGNESQAKALEDRIVPGVGVAAPGVRVDAEVRRHLLGHKQFETATKDLYGFIKQHGGIGSLNPQARAIAEQKALAIQSAVRENELGTVFKAQEVPLLEKMQSNQPLSLVPEIFQLPKLQELIDANRRKYNDTLNSVGIKLNSEAAKTGQQQSVEAGYDKSKIKPGW